MGSKAPTPLPKDIRKISPLPPPPPKKCICPHCGKVVH